MKLRKKKERKKERKKEIKQKQTEVNEPILSDGQRQFPRSDNLLGQVPLSLHYED